MTSRSVRGPLQRFRQSRWFALAWLAPIVLAAVVVCVLLAQWFMATDTGRSFVHEYPGHSQVPDNTPEGFAGWLRWQHALNFFILVLLIRSGWMVRVQMRPEAYWTRNNSGRIQTRRPPTKMSLYLWLHLTLDVAWVVNGLIFVVLLASTGAWKRVVPLHADIFANALSAGLQYLSLNWPLDTPWVNYNALQVLAYFVTIFIAAPLAVLTGTRISPIWSNTWRINKFYPAEIARALHLPVMVYFVAFIVAHVGLVFATGMRRNLNYMFSSQPENSQSWWGLIVFVVTILIVLAGWIAARPLFMSSLASLTGRVTSR